MPVWANLGLNFSAIWCSLQSVHFRGALGWHSHHCDHKTKGGTRFRQIYLQSLQSSLVSYLEFPFMYKRNLHKMCNFDVLFNWYLVPFSPIFKHFFNLRHCSSLYVSSLFKQSLNPKCKETSKAKENEGRTYPHICKPSYSASVTDFEEKQLKAIERGNVIN